MRNKIDISSLVGALFICAVQLAFFLLIYQRYERDVAELKRVRLQFAATQLGQRIEQQLVSRVGVLELYAHLLPSLHVKSNDEFSRWSSYVRAGVPGFFAINFMMPDGTITWVDPRESNIAALGKNPTTRPELTAYVTAAATHRMPRLTHFVPLYQGPIGFAVYVPAFEGRQMLGFLNGVFSVNEFFEPLVRVGRDVVAVRVSVAGRPQLTYTSGTELEGDTVGSYQIAAYGQTFLVEVWPTFKQNDLAVDLLVVGVLVSILLVSVSSYLLLRSRARLRERLERERFQGVLLNLLVHDIQNPVFVTRYSLDAAMKFADESVAKQLKNTYVGLNQLQDLINRVREMRAMDLGKSKPQLAAVMVNALMRDALAAFDLRLREKGLVVELQLTAEDPAIWVDRVIFENNVLANVLSNALKFSEPGSKISVATKVRRDQVEIEIRDQGVGMTAELANMLVQEGRDGQGQDRGAYGSRPGTRGEAGTGIGMLQVVAYTRILGGRVEIHSKSKSLNPDDSGTTVQITLPRVRASEVGPQA